MASIESLIDGSDKLTSIFGYWPSFHDAEVIELKLWRGDVSDPKHPVFPVLTAKLHVWELTKEVDDQGYLVLRHHTVVTLRFHDVLDLQIEGFNQQNAIFGLSITTQERAHAPWARSFVVKFEPAFGMGALFKCSKIEVVEAFPWKDEQ